MGLIPRESESGSCQLAYIGGTATAVANRQESCKNNCKIPLMHVLKHVSKGPDTYCVLTATPLYLTHAQLAATTMGFPAMLISSVRHPAALQRMSRPITSVTFPVRTPKRRMLGPLALGSLSQGAGAPTCPLRKAIGPRTAAFLGDALQLHRRLQELLCSLGDLLLPEWQFTTIVGFISEIVCFPVTENIKF